MKLAKKKISVALDQDIIELLDEYSEVLGSSRSRIINDMIREAYPTLQTVLASVRALKENPELHNFSDVQTDVAEAIYELVNRVSE